MDRQGGRTTWTHDPVGRPLSQAAPNGTRTSWSYDPAGRTILAANASMSLVRRLTYQYDPTGRRTVQAETGYRTTWSYDPAGQLLKEQRGGVNTTAHDVILTKPGELGNSDAA